MYKKILTLYRTRGESIWPRNFFFNFQAVLKSYICHITCIHRVKCQEFFKKKIFLFTSILAEKFRFLTPLLLFWTCAGQLEVRFIYFLWHNTSIVLRLFFDFRLALSAIQNKKIFTLKLWRLYPIKTETTRSMRNKIDMTIWSRMVSKILPQIATPIKEPVTKEKLISMNRA